MAAVTSTSGEDLDTLLNRNDHLAILRHIRSHQLREPHLVIQHGKALLPEELGTKKPDVKATSSPISIVTSTIGLTLTEAERLSILEQVCMAALDVQNQDLANQCLDWIQCLVSASTATNSEESVRVQRLMALRLESLSDYEGALAVYNTMLKENPANSTAFKRKYAILRSQVGKEIEAMEALNDYISYHQGDAAGWYEMSNLCLSIGDYKGATYCYEELVLIQPQDASLHCKLGELYVTRGGVQNLSLARKHIAQSLELSSPSHNLRALYALVDATSAYLEETSSSARKKREHVEEKDVEVAEELLKYGVEMILKLYRGAPSFAVVKDVMDGYLELLEGKRE